LCPQQVNQFIAENAYLNIELQEMNQEIDSIVIDQNKIMKNKLGLDDVKAGNNQVLLS
jgi:prefoldin subunit 5